MPSERSFIDAGQPARLVDDVRQILRQARGAAYAAANTAMVEAYWQIGRRIVEEEQGGASRAEYGRQLIRTLARELGDEFGKGLSVANLWNFRQFYLTFPQAGKLYALRRELSWTHWRLIMRVEDPDARAYYIDETARQQWSSRTLERAIETQTNGSQEEARHDAARGSSHARPRPRRGELSGCADQGEAARDLLGHLGRGQAVRSSVSITHGVDCQSRDGDGLLGDRPGSP